MSNYVIPLDITGTEVMDFVGQTPPSMVGPGTTPKITPKDKQVLFRVLTWNNPDPPPQGRRSKIIQPEYDFTEVSQAHDTDGILRNARDRQLICMMKDSHWFGGKNPRTVAYIQRRIDEISRMSTEPFSVTLRSCAKDLIEYGNFFLYLHRNDKFSSGRRTAILGKSVDPIAALQPIDVTTMRPVLGDTIQVRKWVQVLEDRPIFRSNRSTPLHISTNASNEKSYDIRDIIHGFAWKRNGFIFGTPPCIPVLDDIRALRRLEEISELIAHRHAFPLVHVQVGTEKIPMRVMPTGETEVDIVRNAYESMKMEGALITSERAKVSAIQTKPMPLDSLLEHFESRAVTGLGISKMDLGRGDTSNRGTGLILSRGTMERCKELQQLLSEFITTNLLDYLLLEGGFEPTPENRVHLKFPEVDIERMMEIGNFANHLYNSHSITEDEMREMLGRDPITDIERKRMVFELVQKPAAIIKAVDEPFTQAAKTNRITTNKTQPQNQHGTKKAKTTPVNDSMEIVIKEVKSLREEVISYIDKCIVEEKSIDDRVLWELADAASEKLKDAIVLGTEPSIQKGFKDYVADSKSARTFIYTGALRRRFAKHCALPVVDRLIGSRDEPGEFGSLVNKLRTSTDGKYALKVVVYFDTWLPIWTKVCDVLSDVAGRFGLAQATWIDGAHTVGWRSNSRLKSLSPAQASYHELVDLKDGDFVLEKRGRLPQVELVVGNVTKTHSSCTIRLDSELKEALDLSKPGRRLSILLDNGERTVLPNDIIEGWEYSRDGTLRIPHLENGIVELYDQGRVVGRTRFVIPEQPYKGE